MRIAVVTPYFEEPLDVLRRCLEVLEANVRELLHGGEAGRSWC